MRDAVTTRLRSQLALKLALLVALNLVVYTPYIYLQHHQFFPVATLAPTILDRLIPFWPGSVWLYLSIDLLMPIGPFLMNRRDELLRYASGIILIAVIASGIFLFWPTAISRPAIPNPSAAYRLLISLDQPLHAIPSLHAAFAIYSALCAIFVIRNFDRGKLWPIALWLWATLILLATLTTKQHMLVDILAGSALGLCAYLCVFGKQVSTANIFLPAPTAVNSLNKL